MACGMWTLRLVAAALASFGSVFGAVGQSLTRPGRAVEFESSKPLSVSVKAWPNSKSSGKDGNCPLYGDAPLDSTTSDANEGRFKLSIDKGKKTYTVVYCHSRYVPRVDRDVPNTSKDGTSIIPTPAFLYPADSKTSDAGELINETIKRRVVASFNDLSYLRNVSPELFERAVSELSSDVATSSDRRAGIIRDFARAVRAWEE